MWIASREAVCTHNDATAKPVCVSVGCVTDVMNPACVCVCVMCYTRHEPQPVCVSVGCVTDVMTQPVCVCVSVGCVTDVMNPSLCGFVCLLDALHT